jgi:uncharacterized damage-inducible protein DinB
MNSKALLLTNFEEIRRRSLKAWSGIPHDKLHWKPDAEALSCIEMVCHVLESTYNYMEIVKARGSVKNLSSPFEGRPFVSVDDEIAFAAPYRKTFLELVQSFSEQDLEHIRIDRSDIGYVRSLGDFLLRVGYHEAVHCGQMLDYLRTMQIERPNIWD